MIIAIDFDGTIVDHRYPDIGNEVPGAIKWIKAFQEAGAKIFLWTMRSDGDSEGDVLTQAVEWCRDRGLEFWGVNENPGQNWSISKKQYAHVYIDDAAYGCPLRENVRMGGKPYVDWEVVGPGVIKMIEDYQKSR